MGAVINGQKQEAIPGSLQPRRIETTALKLQKEFRIILKKLRVHNTTLGSDLNIAL